MPRHPPCALHSLSHKHNTTTIATKMLASTMQISNNKPTNHHPHTTRDQRKEAPSQPTNRLIPQGPTVCQPPPTRPPPPGSTPTRPPQRDRAGRTAEDTDPEPGSVIRDSTSGHPHGPPPRPPRRGGGA